MKNNPVHQIAEIKDMMEKSSRFISLSGLSGISVGIIAIIGSMIAFFLLDYDLRYFQSETYFMNHGNLISMRTVYSLFIVAVIILSTALSSAVFFTVRKARRSNLKVWNHITKVLLANLMVPLVTGGVFCIILGYYGLIFLIAPATLIFYGLALINASKYTFNEVRWLGILEILLGLLAAIFSGYGLFAWATGFGVLHIIYGSVMYFKYDKKVQIQ
jgi:MFS family permease